MAEYILETQNLGISFGGLKAVQDVNLKIKRNQIYGLIGPNGAGKTTVFNLLTCVYKPTTGTFFLDGEELKGLAPHVVNHKGIARTFQNIRLFNNMTVVRNVMVGLHNRPEFKCSFLESMLRLPRHFAVEKKMREKAKELLRDMILERENPYEAVFSPQRTMLHPQLAVNVGESAWNLLTPTVPRCPHMGCALKYNHAEHSWDCPCHGSRFSRGGELLDGPAADDKSM